MTMADRIAVLSAGHKMQYDPPDNIYNRPAALFVAGFTGAPPMNLADCTLQGDAAVLGDLRIPLPADLARRGTRHPRLKFGVRPENLRLVREHDADVAIAGQVVLLEPLGAETLVTLQCGHAEMVARLPAQFRQAPGSTTTLYLNPAHFHLFDAESGAAV
jgi:multiple sugar transport system ATP-binding protein